MIRTHLKEIYKSKTIYNLIILYIFVLAIELSKELLLFLYTDVTYNIKFYIGLFFYPFPFLILPLVLPKITRIYAIVLFSIFSISAFIYFSHIFLYGSDLTPSVYYAIWETNINEASDYLKDYFNLTTVLLILSLITLSIIAFRLLKSKKYKLHSFAIILAILLVGFSVFTKIYSKTIPVKFISNYYQYKSELKEFKSKIEIRKTTNYKDLNPIHCADTLPKTIVMIIGESASKYHQGLYGYKRQTNPLLNEIKEELYIYNDVIAPHSHTNPALSKILTFANHESMYALYNNRSIIEYMNDAGFYTCWLSNQQFAHQYTTVSSSIGIQSDFYVFTHSNQSKDKHSYDGKLLKPLKKALDAKHDRKFIVLHLMGSHSDKRDRFPKEFKVFNDTIDIPNESYVSDWYKYLINSHDNSVLYNDWVLRQCIELLREEAPNAALLYFADHGEEMYEYRDFFGHGEGNASIYMFDIPFFLWLSDGYKQNYSDKVKHFDNHLDRKYQTDDIIHSIIDLTNCYSKDFEKEKSIFNVDFKFRERKMGKFNYDELIRTKKSITDK